MSKFIIFFFICCSAQLFGQNNMQWEALPAQENSGAEIIYQSPQGFLFAELPLAKKTMMSKDDAKTWQTVSFQDSFFYHKFANDNTGGIYCYSFNKIYKLDTSQNRFKHFLTIAGESYNDIHDIGFKGDKLYIAASYDLQIYDLNTLQLIFTKSYLFSDFASPSRLIFGPSNKNYIKTKGGSNLYPTLNSFNDDGTNYTELGEKEELYSDKIYALKSGKLIALYENYLYSSIDGGISWKKTGNSMWTIEQLFVSKNNEIMISGYRNIETSNDEGTTWTKIAVPKNNFNKGYFWNNNAGKLIFASSDCYIKTAFISADKGITWTEQSMALDLPQTFKISLTPENDILSKNCYSFNEFKPFDSPTWEKTKLRDSLYSDEVYVLPSGQWIVPGFSYLNYYTSKDKGKTWQKFDKFPDMSDTSIKHRRIYLNQFKELLYAAWDKYYLSKDEGLTWEEFESTNFYSTYRTTEDILMVKDYILYAHDDFMHIYNQTSKKMESFNDMKGKFLNNVSAPLSLKDDKVCFWANIANSSLWSYLYISADFGKTFISKKLPKLNGSTIKKMINGDKNSLLLLTSDDLYVSYNEGDTWLSIKGDLPNDVEYSTMTISHDNFLYVGMMGAPIYKSKTTLDNTIKTKDSFSDIVNFSLFPNPTEDELNIQIADNQEDKSNVLIYSIDGKLLQQTQFYGNSTSLNVQQLPQGIYLFQLKNGAKTSTKRFVKN